MALFLLSSTFIPIPTVTNDIKLCWEICSSILQFLLVNEVLAHLYVSGVQSVVSCVHIKQVCEVSSCINEWRLLYQGYRFLMSLHNVDSWCRGVLTRGWNYKEPHKPVFQPAENETTTMGIWCWAGDFVWCKTMTYDLKLYVFGTPSAATLSAGTHLLLHYRLRRHFMISLQCFGQIKLVIWK